MWIWLQYRVLSAESEQLAESTERQRVGKVNLVNRLKLPNGCALLYYVQLTE